MRLCILQIFGPSEDVEGGPLKEEIPLCGRNKIQMKVVVKQGQNKVLYLHMWNIARFLDLEMVPCGIRSPFVATRPSQWLGINENNLGAREV